MDVQYHRLTTAAGVSHIHVGRSGFPSDETFDFQDLPHREQNFPTYNPANPNQDIHGPGNAPLQRHAGPRSTLPPDVIL